MDGVMILPDEYFPEHKENRMAGEGDVISARKRFFAARPPGLEKLLQQRYGWMNEYLSASDVAVEFGCGAGFSRQYLRCNQLILTDVEPRPWVDVVTDALDPPFGDGSLDAVICSHMIHHLAHPARLFDVARAKLKVGGVLIIQDLNTSFFLRLLLRLMKHEGWSYRVDVFDRTAVANDPRDPWSANCAIPQLLFADMTKFQCNVQGWKVLRNSLNECLLFPLSGGVIAKARIPTFPAVFYDWIALFDGFLTRVCPSVFALGRSVVLQREW